MIEKIIEYSARNKFVVILFVAFATLIGVWSMRNVALDAIPDLSDPQVIIFTEWKGRSPDIMEDQVTYPIVSAMVAAPKVKVARGYSFLGLSFVYVIFEEGTDLYWARSRVIEYIDRIKGNLPDGVTPTLGPDATGVGWVYEYALVDESGKNNLADIRSFQDWYLKYRLESVQGVAEVAAVGGFVKQYQVKVDPNALASYKIPLKHVIMQIKKSNNDVGGRVLEMDSGTEFFIRGRGYIQGVKDIENIVVGTYNKGTPILVKNIADVATGPDMRRGMAELNGKGEVVGGIVVMRYGENALKVIERVKKKIEEVEPFFPEGIKMVNTYDRSDLILRSIKNLYTKLFEEFLVVSLVSIIFLSHFRSSLVAIIMLPIAIILSFIPMYGMKITSNIMSLAGIAIAIGAMIDAAIVMIENAHKHIETEKGKREDIIIRAAKQVGRPLFFSLLIITVSFLPVFTLEAQEGRLFKPLAYTKTFSMFFAALLSITLVPVLMSLFIKGKIKKAEDNPITRTLIHFYDRLMRVLLRKRKPVVVAGAVLLIATLPAFFRLGSEFMPPLNEGTIMYMPTTLPGISIGEVSKLVKIQDKILKEIPEVETVFGKAGRANTATDPAPLSMIETNIILKDKKYRRKGMTREKLIEEMDRKMQFPGLTNAWTMPIKGRIDMLTTGIKTPIGIKIYGADLNKIQGIGEILESTLKQLPETRSVYAERVTGGYFIDFKVNREEAARYGLSVENIQDVIKHAIGGMNIGYTIEGKERYPINVRYGSDYRDNIDKLKRVLVSAPGGRYIPLYQVADVEVKTGPPMIKNENGMLTGWVYVDIKGSNVGSYVKKAQALVKKDVIDKKLIPRGYSLKWSGQYEYMQRVKQKLGTVLPLTLLIIFVLLYFNSKSVVESLIVMLSIPFSLIGAVWMLYILGYNTSVAVWVGIIALAGVAAELGIVMLVYINTAFKEKVKQGKMRNMKDLSEAIMEGAVQRVRPKVMTVAAIVAGLLPIMWGHGAGGDVMRRIAAPMIGGIVTAALTGLILYPVIYSLWKEREFRLKSQNSGLKSNTKIKRR